MPESIHIAICGDVMLGRLVNETIPHRGYSYPWGNMLPLIKECDLFLINQEFALTSHTVRWRNGEKAFYFRADPQIVNSLTSAGVSFASLANNHIADFDTAGLLETIDVLDRAGIAHAGAGANVAAARAPAFVEAKGIRIGIVAFADYPLQWAATIDRPGINYAPISLSPSDFERIEWAIDTAQASSDVVIFSIHWGPNMRARPPLLFQTFARRVIDAGADLFWGHSAHVVQGIEFYHGTPILYDTGDFVDDYAVDLELRNDLTALFLLEIGLTGVISLKLIPASIDHMQINQAEGADRTWLIERLIQLCSEFGTRLVVAPDERAVSAECGDTSSSP